MKLDKEATKKFGHKVYRTDKVEKPAVKEEKKSKRQRETTEDTIDFMREDND